MTLRELIKKTMEETLTKNKGNRTKTARDLGISVRTIRNWLSRKKKAQGTNPPPDSL